MATLKKEKKLLVKKSYLDIDIKKEGILISLYRLMSDKREKTISHLFTKAFIAKVNAFKLGDNMKAKDFLDEEIQSFWKNGQRNKFNGWTRERDIHNALVRAIGRKDLCYYYGKFAQVHADNVAEIKKENKDVKTFLKSQELTKV